MFTAIPDANFGLNLDPSHLVWLMIDYERAVYDFGDRIFHAHAKDLEIRRDGLYRHGTLSGGIGWQVPRLPGLGEVDWSRFVAALYARRLRPRRLGRARGPALRGRRGARQARLPDRARHAAAARPLTRQQPLRAAAGEPLQQLGARDRRRRPPRRRRGAARRARRLPVGDERAALGARIELLQGRRLAHAVTVAAGGAARGASSPSRARCRRRRRRPCPAASGEPCGG